MKSPSPIYVITPKTKAIITKGSSYYHSLILETGRKRTSIYKPQCIIDHSCEINGSTLIGRRNAAGKILKTRSKLPIPVAPHKDVYMLPTASIKNNDCVWISYYHIYDYEQRDDKTFIAFHDGSGLYVNASVSAIDMQFKRTSHVIAQMNHPFFH